MSTGTEPGLRARNLRTLALLAALFLVPLALAFFIYYGTAWRPLARVNHGELITPARPLPAGALHAGAARAPGAPAALFRDQWTLVYIGDGGCADACRQALYVMRQTRLSLNNDMTRVARVFLATGQLLRARVPRARARGPGRARCDRPRAQALLRAIPGR